MNTYRISVSAALVIVLSIAAAPAGAADIVIINNDDPGEGFNDPGTPTPEMGCPVGMTLGQCRLNAFATAANQWGSTLESTVPIRIGAQFNPLFCDPSGAVLGSAGSATVVRDFPGAPFPGTWYHSALADALSGVDQFPAGVDIIAQFNSNLDSDPTCTLNWWYGTDGAFPGNREIDPDPNATHFYAVLLHEMAHGLGFQNFINSVTGQLMGGFPDVYSRFTYDTTTGLHWDEMNNAQRVSSAINTGNVVLDSPFNKMAADDFLTGDFVDLIVNSGPAAGTYAGRGALFGGGYNATEGVTLDMEVVNDGAGVSTTDGCEPLVGFTTGRIALIDRGDCQFGTKALNAEQAGAGGVIVADNQVSTPFQMAPGEVGRQVTIPVMYITQADADVIRPTLPVSGTYDVLDVNGQHAATGFPLIYTPNPVEPGSSVSHYDVLAGPNALMEPIINVDLYNDPDMALGLYRDEGWVVNEMGEIFADGFESGGTTVWSNTVP